MNREEEMNNQITHAKLIREMNRSIKEDKQAPIELSEILELKEEIKEYKERLVNNDIFLKAVLGKVVDLLYEILTRKENEKTDTKTTNS